MLSFPFAFISIARQTDTIGHYWSIEGQFVAVPYSLVSRLQARSGQDRWSVNSPPPPPPPNLFPVSGSSGYLLLNLGCVSLLALVACFPRIWKAVVNTLPACPEVLMSVSLPMARSATIEKGPNAKYHSAWPFQTNSCDPQNYSVKHAQCFGFLEEMRNVATSKWKTCIQGIDETTPAAC